MGMDLWNGCIGTAQIQIWYEYTGITERYLKICGPILIS